MPNKPAIWLQSIQHGFIATLPVVILGAFALTFLQITSLLLTEDSVSEIRVFGDHIQRACSGVMALILVLSITHKLAKYYRQKYQLNYDPVIVAILAMVTLVAMAHLDNGLDAFQYLGVAAIGKGLFCSILFTELYVFFYRHRLFKPSYPNEAVDTALLTAIRSTWPALLAPISMLVLYSLIAESIEHFSFWFSVFVGQIDPATGLSFWQTVKLILVNQLSWFVGIHGSSIIEIQADTMFLADAGIVYSRQYINMFAHIGGAGATFGLVIALLLSKERTSNQLGRFAFIPSLFNINELLIFGLPIIFNRYLLLPFILVPILCASLFRVVFDLGWVSWSGGAESWSTPVLLGGYLATGQWQGLVLQAACILLSVSIYYPFLMRFESNRRKMVNDKQFHMLNRLNNEIDLKRIFESKSGTGRFSRALVKEFNSAISKDQIDLFYQPKVNNAGRVVGAEALLRWRHPKLGFISPGMIVALSELDGSIHDLGLWVIKRTLSDMNALNKAGLRGVKIAINVSPYQFERDDFFNDVIKLVERSRIDPGLIELEITESSKIDLGDRVLQGLQQLAEYGFHIAVDDFGMGYTSLRYLKSFPVHTLKIDGSIVRDVSNSKMVKEIIGSMGQLANSMGVNLVAEWVETDLQKMTLHELGCDEFQGYLMSPPLALKDFTKYCAVKGVDLPVVKSSR